MRKGCYYSLEDYIITKNGEVINKHNHRKLKPQLNGKGYLRVIIGNKRYFVHRLVAQKYISNPKNKLQVNHKDGNKTNNCVNNLEWVTNQENRNHAIKNNLHVYGDKCSYAKLNSQQVLTILDLLKSNKYTLVEIANMFGVNRATISDIKHNRTWKQLKRYAELSQIESDRNKG